MIRSICPVILCVVLSWSFARADDLVLAPDIREVPGEEPTPWLKFREPTATNVAFAGSWDQWKTEHRMTRNSGIWAADIRSLQLPFGRHEFKFIVDGVWEPGDNRLAYINEEHLFEKPPDVIYSALIQDTNLIAVSFKRGVKQGADLNVRIEPYVVIEKQRVSSPKRNSFQHGYAISGDTITFVLSEADYGLDLDPHAKVVVAGNFNGWNSDGGGGRWQLQDPDNDGLWRLTTQLQALRAPAGEKDRIFKFVVHGQQWLAAPAGAFNRTPDGKGNVNLRIDPNVSGSTTLELLTQETLDLTVPYRVEIDGLLDKAVSKMLSPGKVFDRFYSSEELGAILRKDLGATTYRLFAPRAKSVDLCVYDTPEYEVLKPAYKKLEPAEKYPMWRDDDGVWEVTLLGLDTGAYYSFNVDGPSGDGEGFNAEAQVGDPYARAAAHAENNTIVLDREETNKWFSGWKDHLYEMPDHRDIIIYETHVRNLTMHPSSGVSPKFAGKYLGILESEGTGTGLDHLRDMGVNMIELMPVGEFNNGLDRYDWGYATTFFFAPEASYGLAPLTGSQYYEFKHLVNSLHEKGFGVILDVVYNHAGSPNVFSLIDRKYFFRLNPDYTFSNYSGVGTDFRSESLMMRRLIIDNILYWMREHHVDGFRFDLAELIDMETLMAIRDAARALNPDVLLISEPWSFRGEHKSQLKGTGWSAWNNDFRYAAKGFVMGDRNRDALRKCIAGSTETWAANPMQVVNYVESHDDMALADELSTRPDRDGSHLQPMDLKANRLAATILFTSLGIPMIAEGQEFVRSKRGIHNTYNRGDELNALRWTDRERPGAAETMAYYRSLIHLRQSANGAAFRVAQRAPEGYYQWITPAEEQALGYIVNAPKRHDGAGFVVLLNASPQTTSFTVPFPKGSWRLIGNGQELDPGGLENAPTVQGPAQNTVKVPGMTAYVFMNGF